MRFDYTLNWDRDKRWRPATTTIDLEGTASDDHIMLAIAKAHCFYERDLLEHIALFGPRGGIFVDVGANIGNHSVYFGKFLADYLIAIEPVKTLASILRRNLSVNGVANAEVFELAVAEKPGAGRMRFLESAVRNDSMGVLEAVAGPPPRPGEACIGEVVEVSTLDRVVGAVTGRLGDLPVSFMKLDIEGGELAALQGACELLDRHRPQLAIELSTPDAFESTRALLSKFGYVSGGQFCWTPTFHFLDPRKHPYRPLRLRLAHSWRLGALGQIRRRLGLR